MHSLYEVEIVYAQCSLTCQKREDSEHTGRPTGGGGADGLRLSRRSLGQCEVQETGCRREEEVIY